MVWERSDRGVLAVFGPDGKPIAREEFPCSVLSAVAADLMGDGRPEVTVALREGGIGFYDGDLDLLAQYGFAHEAVSVQQAADADADGKSELVVVTTGAREPGLEASGAKVWEERSPALQALSTPRVGWLDLWPRVAWRAQPLPATFSGLEQPTVPTLLLDRPRPLLLAVSPLTTDSGRALAFETMPHRPALRSKVGSLFPGQRVDAIEWDAEGRRAALVAGPDGHLALHDPAGTRPRTLCERGPVGQVRWSPDGRQVAFVLGADPAVADLHVVDVAGGRERAIPGSRGLQGYSWSPDSRRLAFGTTPAEGKGDLCIAPADGGAAALVTGASDRDRLEAFPAWDGGGSRLYFVRSVSVPTRGGRLPGTALACVDLRTGAVRLLTPDATLRAALDRARREMPAVAFSKAVQQDLVPEVAGPLTWDSSRRMLVFALRITRVNRPEYSTDTNRYRGCPDLWTYEVEGDRLSRLTADDECSEADPDWSPQGDWLVYEGQPVQGAGPARVRLTNRLGSFVADLGEGTSPRWEGASSRRVTLIRDGKVQLLTLEADLPEVAGPPSPWGFGVGSLAAGAVLAAVALRTRPWVRLRRSAAFVTSAWRAAQLGFDPDAFRRFVRLLAELDNTLHSLKNAVFVIGAGTGDSVSLDDIAFCLDPENVAAVRTLTQAALEQAGRLARDEALYRHAVSDFSPATRDALVRALDAVLDSQASLARGLQRVNRHAGALDAYGKLSEAARQEAVDRAAADLDAFHALVDGPEGLRRHLLRALDGISLAGPLQQAAQVVSRRATDLGLQVVIPPEAGRIRVCGDPAPLADLFAGCLDNALDSLARRAQEDPNGPPLNVTITVQDGNPVTVAFTDGGMGIAPDLLARLRAGHAVSTKGAGRGSGLTRAREVLARRYPHGALEVSSPGENQGATVRVQVGTA
jgi:dipeptidyl aminopeptidase/acylaminoacyl peptidase